ncbi:MAG: hypothetical protein M1830_002406 [Pleopsidium flavum]|nr:MAG: hypothetical protein M1830_002406 [Pleopsidium flavum]
MAFKDRSSASGGGFMGWIIHAILRSLQFVFALTVAGLYGTDLSNARKHGVGGDPKWVYAEVVAGLSALTSIIYMVPLLKSFYLFAWDAVLL